MGRDDTDPFGADPGVFFSHDALTGYARECADSDIGRGYVHADDDLHRLMSEALEHAFAGIEGATDQEIEVFIDAYVDAVRGAEERF